MVWPVWNTVDNLEMLLYSSCVSWMKIPSCNKVDPPPHKINYEGRNLKRGNSKYCGNVRNKGLWARRSNIHQIRNGFRQTLQNYGHEFKYVCHVHSFCNTITSKDVFRSAHCCVQIFTIMQQEDPLMRGQSGQTPRPNHTRSHSVFKKYENHQLSHQRQSEFGPLKSIPRKIPGTHLLEAELNPRPQCGWKA
jgi:hypothetical protein